MKRFLIAILFAMSVALSYAQDIITFKDGSVVKGKIYRVTANMIEYLDNFNERCVASKSQIFSINYESGKVETFDNAQPVPTYLMQDDRETTRLRRLKVWKKITRVYGIVNLACGMYLVSLSNNPNAYEDSEDYEENKNYNKTLGIIGIAEGSTALIVSICLQAKRNRLLRESNAVGSVPIMQKDFKINDHLTLSPSVNLMSYRQNPAEGVGAGLSIKF